ncbi:MAG: 5-formyltetrahydrofolate cyclo-ligase [Planctomycetia bacterium]|nr:5-formyltetrahydrofolate cyclo-ligase [Planctomycetia bacterium]
MSNVSDQKTELRKNIRLARKREEHRPEKSVSACRRLVALLEWACAQTVLVYVSYQSEVETDTLLDTLLKTPEKRCIVPLCLENGGLKLVEIRSRSELVPGAYGILEPCASVAEMSERNCIAPEIDLAVIPGIAFDARGRRLGQGGGYYDRLLPCLRPEVPTIGLAFECQIVPEIPCEAHDSGVKYLITEARTLRIVSQPTIMSEKPRPEVWGILGGIACGKSLVSEFFRSRGIPVFDADRFGHSLYDRQEIRDALLQRWGNHNILNMDGTFNRQKIAEIVFAPENKSELEFLNALFHTTIHHGWLEFLANAQSAGASLVILDAALLLETGWDRECSALLFIDTPRTRQEKFAQARGWTLEELEAREKNQFPLSQKRAAATWIVPNDSTPTALGQRLETMLQSLLRSF